MKRRWPLPVGHGLTLLAIFVAIYFGVAELASDSGDPWYWTTRWLLVPLLAVITIVMLMLAPVFSRETDESRPRQRTTMYKFDEAKNVKTRDDFTGTSDFTGV